jgi:hypothetical protein
MWYNLQLHDYPIGRDRGWEPYAPQRKVRERRVDTKFLCFETRVKLISVVSLLSKVLKEIRVS